VSDWWQAFFDADYVHLWGQSDVAGSADAQVSGLWSLLDHAERERGGLPPSQLRYLQHDLRKPLGEGGFDCALNIFTSLGYGTEEDDVAILATLRAAVRPGGLVFVETAHRDLAVTLLASGMQPSQRRPDGDLLVLVRPVGPGEEGGIPASVYGDGAGPLPRPCRARLPVRPSRLLPRALPRRGPGPRRPPRAAGRAGGLIPHSQPGCFRGKIHDKVLTRRCE